MRKLLIVIDMQNDFVTGSLENKNAMTIVEPFVKKVKEEYNKGTDILFTRDTHYDNYLQTLEGKKLPVEHCIKDTEGWQLVDGLKQFVEEKKLQSNIINKDYFGCANLKEEIKKSLNISEEEIQSYDQITLAGVCTSICVISNAMILKASLPEVNIAVYEDLSACLTPETHKHAIESMRTAQVDILKGAI